MKSLQIVGRKKSGKTGLTVRLIPLLQDCGLRVGTIKHSSHPHPLDRTGSDSQRHRGAGAEATMVITAAAVALHIPAPTDPAETGALVERFLGSLDLVLIEGWSKREGTRLEVLPPDPQGEPRVPLHLESGDLLGVVLAPGLQASPDALARFGARMHPCGDAAAAIPCFSWDDVRGIVDLVMRWYEGPG